MALLEAALLQLLLVSVVRSWNDGGVLLRDVQVLTLYKDRYTTARRSSPIPQLRCVGGTAGCQAFVPEVVQCVNKGWDGQDVQWECRTDMDDSYRFGRLEVNCEGYQHPADAYVLQGSCGLEFTLELTAEGRRRAGGSGGLGALGSAFFSSFSGSQQRPAADAGSGGLLPVVLLLLVAFAVYKLFLSGNTSHWGPDGAPTPSPPGDAAPPPPGFKPHFTGFTGASTGYNDYTQRPQYPQGFAAPNTGGGFWTGMGTGGLLGYLFGRQRSGTYNQPYSSFSHGSPYMSRPPSSGTRSASGFGGTKKR